MGSIQRGAYLSCQTLQPPVQDRWGTLLAAAGSAEIICEICVSADERFGNAEFADFRREFLDTWRPSRDATNPIYDESVDDSLRFAVVGRRTEATANCAPAAS